MESLELLAREILKQCETVSLGSVTESGYPYICPMEKVIANGIRQIYFITLKTSNKVKYFRKNAKAGVNYYIEDYTVSLNGIINIIEDVESEIIKLPKIFRAITQKRKS
ncbi:MAG: pyridoxamine 5'-phosphate oxidase family protein [Sedimentibacter sp.]